MHYAGDDGFGHVCCSQDATIHSIPHEEAGWNATRGVVVALCFMLNMLDGTDMLIMSFIAPMLSDLWRISPERLGVLFSASLGGMAIGCLLIAPLADRFGRRRVIIGSLLLVATAMIVSGLAHSLAELMAARLLVGVGVGTIGVSMTAMTAEFAPDRHADFAVGFVQAGWPLGSIITAFVAVRELQIRGWQPLLIGIGLLSAALLLLISLLLPESLSFLATRRPARALERLNAVRRRLALPMLPALPDAVPAKLRGLQIAALFHDGRATASILLWSAVTLTYFVLYFVISWVPKLVAQAGLPLSEAIYAGATYNLGAFIGTTAVGWIAIHLPLRRVVASFLGLAAIAMLVFGGFGMPVWLTLLVALCVGMTVQGGFNGFWAVAARLYPAAMRSTGIGWALGVGRIGAVLGPIVGGVLVGARVPIATIFTVYTLPLVAAACMTLGIKLKR
jgi:benzoate transport